MGLFGYNEKDYKKNTDQIRTQIDGIYSLVDVDTRKVLNTIQLMLDSVPYPNTKSKDMENIDKLVLSVTNKMVSAARDKSLGMVKESAAWLYELINRNRQYGEVTYDDKIISRRENLIALEGRLNDLLLQQAAKKARRDQILSETEGMSEDSYEFQKYSDEFENIEQDLNMLDSHIGEYRSTIMVEKQAMREIDSLAVLTPIDSNEVVPTAELERTRREMEKLQERIHDKRNAKKDMLNEAQASRNEYARENVSSSSLADVQRAKQAAKMNSSIQNSDAAGGKQESALSRARREGK